MTVSAIVVTHNRLALLKKCLAAVRAQSQPAAEIIVVNNGSTDGTSEWLAEQSGLTVITQDNQGSSGGQYAGIKAAYHKGHDWFWCMDDDTIPDPEALQNLTHSPHFTDASTGFLSSLVLWKDRSICRRNAPQPCLPADWCTSVLGEHCIPVTNGTFVSLLVSRRAIDRVGLPIREFFIWFDDVEFTARIVRQMKGYVVLDSTVVHDTAANDPVTPLSVSPEIYSKYCYAVRNCIAMHRMHAPSTYVRIRAIESISRQTVLLVLRGRAPIGTIAWVIRGLFFFPRPEWP